MKKPFTKPIDLTIVPPNDINLEFSVLGAILIDRDAMMEVTSFIDSNVFYYEKNKMVFDACMTLFTESKPIDIRTVVNKLRENKNLEEVGGAFYVSELTFRIQSSANVAYHCGLLKQMAIRRALLPIAWKIQSNALDQSLDIFDTLDAAQNEIADVRDVKSGDIKTTGELLPDSLADIEKSGMAKNGVTGIASGFEDLDKITSGWQKTDLIVVAARPAMGKTAFCICMALHAVKANHPVGVISMEMSKQQLMLRLISIETDIDIENLKRGKLSADQWEILTRNISNLRTSNFIICDKPNLSIAQLKAIAKKMKAKYNIEMLVVDYLQLAKGDSKDGNRESEIAAISRGLKAIAKELDIPVIALSQLSRLVEQRPNKKPQLSDLRESGSIEQDADMVIFLLRPEYYGFTEDEDGGSTKGLAKVIIAKHRNGPIDTIKLKYIGRLTKFIDWEKYYPSNIPLPEFNNQVFKVINENFQSIEPIF